MTVNAYTTTSTVIDQYQLNAAIDQRVAQKLEPLLKSLEDVKAKLEAKLAEEPVVVLADLSTADKTRKYTDKDGDEWEYVESDYDGEAGWTYGSYAQDSTAWAGPFTIVPKPAEPAPVIYQNLSEIPVGTRFGIARGGKRAADKGVWTQFISGGKYAFAHGEDAVPSRTASNPWVAESVQRFAPFIKL
ncbi:hypothetical protein ACWF99_23790 [Nocardia sp. NPDC055002]